MSISSSSSSTTNPDPGLTINGTRGNDDILGAGGDDVIKGRGGDDYVSGLGGNDTVKGGRGNDIVKGGDGNDLLRGGAGDDVIDAGAGNDVLFGGSGADLFYFSGGYGDNTIKDFELGVDKIQLSGLSFTSFEDVMSEAFDDGGKTAIFVDDTVIIIEGVTPDELTADDFIF